MTVLQALREMWALVADERWILYTAFVALIVAAASEISMPGILAASVFSAQKGEMSVFYQNSRLLILLCFTSGICSGLRSGCFAVANTILVGFFYLRYVADPKTLWSWYQPYLRNDVSPKQPDSKQCGFFVMRFMKEIIDVLSSVLSSVVPFLYEDILTIRLIHKTILMRFDLSGQISYYFTYNRWRFVLASGYLCNI